MKLKKTRIMEFGKKVYVGNFVVVKKNRSLSKREMERLRDEAGVPKDVRKHLTRGALPYMHIENAGGGWELNIGIGMSMFEALDELSVARDERGDWRVPGIEGKNAEAVITGMFVDTTVVGDAEYQGAKMKAMCEYIERNSKKEGDDRSSGDTSGSGSSMEE